MVESSSYFIVFEFFKRYLASIQASVHDAYVLLIWGGLALLLVSFSLLLKRSPGKTAYLLRFITRVSSLILFIVFLMLTFDYFHFTLERWAFLSFGFAPSSFYAYALLILFFLIALLCGVISTRMPKTPDKDSTLNARQTLQCFACIAGVFAIGSALWIASNDAFSLLVLIILGITELLCLFVWFYDVFLYALSHFFRSKKADPSLQSPTPGKINRFAFIICAHNEEKVIGSLLDSLFEMNYPRTKYDVIVICDHCTDETASLARQGGALVKVRDGGSRQGKNESLKWIFETLENDRGKASLYDAYVILNADSLVNEQYLLEINKHLNLGHEVLQTSQSSKNPLDTISSRCASIECWLRNAGYQEAHSRLKLFVQVRDNGMVVRPSALREVAWETDSLVEELDFCSQYLLKKGVVVHWVSTARFYDEQPLSVRAAMNERTRWMQGHMSAMMRYTPALLKAAISQRRFRYIDAAIHLMRPMFLLVTLVIYAARLAFVAVFPSSIAGVTLFVTFDIALILALSYLLFQCYALSTEGSLKYAPWLPVFYVSTFFWASPLMRGFMKRNEKFWVPSFHARSLSIYDVDEDLRLSEARQRLSGLSNLHTLPIGQILLKAAIITGPQLQEALSIQHEKGGSLGYILVKTGAITSNTLETYLEIQQAFRESSYHVPGELQNLRLGEVLLNAGIITREDLLAAIMYQKEYGGQIGQSFVAMNLLTPEVLDIFLAVQNVISENYLDVKDARTLLQNISYTPSARDYDVISVIVNSGLVSKQQLDTAQIFADAHGKSLYEALLNLGFVTQDTCKVIKRAINSYILKGERINLPEKVGE